MRRREFVRGTVVAGIAAAAGPTLLLPRKTSGAEDVPADLVAVRNGEPDAMLDRALEALGGMGRFVPKGSTVAVKPNIGWPRAPETGANTNPILVGRIVEACLQAGAAKVYVFDHTVGEQKDRCYAMSGIEESAKKAGAVVAPASQQRYYGEVTIPGGDRLKTVLVHELVQECDVLINVPVLKHHMGSRATIGMKNLMGVIWDRQAYHKQGLHDCIAEFCLYKKPDLTIVDAYRVTMDNGPQRARPEDVVTKKMLIASPDIVAADSAAVRVLNSTPEEASHIALAAKKGIGVADLENVNIRRIAL